MSVLIITEKSHVSDILNKFLSDKCIKVVALDAHVYTKDETTISVSDLELQTTLKLENVEEDAWLLGRSRVHNAWMQIQNVIANNPIHCIINACDDDKNGDYLFNFVYEQIDSNVPVKRMHIKDLCDKQRIRDEYERCWNEFLEESIYLKIYVENGDTLVLEGRGNDDVNNVYYPARWDDVAHRIGTVVIGKHHVSITHEAIRAFTDIVDKAKHTGDDVSCLDIHNCYGRDKNDKFLEHKDEICVSYMGDVVERLNIEEVIKDDNFFIGCGEGRPRTYLLGDLVVV